MCRYATAGTDTALLLVSAALVPRFITFGTDYVLPAMLRRTTKAYTQEAHHALLLNGEFHLGRAVAEISLLTMHTLTYGAVRGQLGLYSDNVCCLTQAGPQLAHDVAHINVISSPACPHVCVRNDTDRVVSCAGLSQQCEPDGCPLCMLVPAAH
jgi:hypothetical protein